MKNSEATEAALKQTRDDYVCRNRRFILRIGFAGDWPDPWISLIPTFGDPLILKSGEFLFLQRVLADQKGVLISDTEQEGDWFDHI